jgi:hypothetical protein
VRRNLSLFLGTVLLLCASNSFGQNDTIPGHFPIKIISRDSIQKTSLKNSPPEINSFFNNVRQLAPSTFNDFQKLNSQLKLPVNLNSGIISISKTSISSKVYSSNVSAESGEHSIYRSAIGSANVSIWNIPFSIGYNLNSGWQTDAQRLGCSTGKFDREKFFEQIKSRIRNVANPEELFAKNLSSLYAKREQAINSIKNDLLGAFENGDEKLLGTIHDKVNAENISRQGIDQFLNKIINENAAQVTETQNLLLQLQNNPGNKNSDSISALTKELQELNRVKEQIEGQLISLRDKWHKGGTWEKISGFEKEKRSIINKLINDPATISRVAAQKLSLTGIQKMLLNTKSLNVGSSGIDQGSLGLHNALIKGINLEFLKGQKYFAPLIGSQPGLKSISDFMYSNFQELPNIFSAAVRMGKGDPQNNFSHVSVALYQQTNNQFLPGNFQTSLPKNLVTTFSKRISFGASHSLLTEVSKSTMLYSNTAPNNNFAKGIFNSDNIFGNVGMNLNYVGEFEKLGIDENLTIRYTGKEYSNLGNFYSVSGSKEISNDLKKYFLNRKLIATVKASYRQYEFALNDRKWNRFSYTADLKWKMKKSQFIEIRYQPYFNKRINLTEKYTAGKSYRLSLRGNMNQKIGRGSSYRNFVEMSSSKDSYYDVFSDKFHSTRSLSFTSFQELSLGKHTIFLNFVGNHAGENLNYLLGNSSLSIDGGLTLSPFKNISLSSAFAYNSVSNMYSQLAVRQSINIFLGDKFIIDGFINAGKNLYQNVYLKIPEISGTLSISYNIK